MSNFKAYLGTLVPSKQSRAAIQSAATMLSGEVGPQCEAIQRLYTELDKAADSLDPASVSADEVQDLLKAAMSLMQAANQLTARANAYSERLEDLASVLKDG